MSKENRLLSGSIDFSTLIEQAKLGHKAFKIADNGRIYMNVNVWLNSEPDQYKNHASVQLNYKDAKSSDKMYIGNLKYVVKKEPVPISQKDTELIPEVAFQSFCDVINAYKKHLNEKRMREHNRVSNNLKLLELQSAPCPEHLHQEFLERMAKNKKIDVATESNSDKIQNYNDHIAGFKEQVGLEKDVEKLKKLQKDYDNIITERINELKK